MTDAVSVGRRVIQAEAEALGLLAEGLDAAFSQAVEALFAAQGRIILTGVGKSGH
ncbi:MAG: KpsF/GutQ family sugar-phosphate isomerase, partial [Caulobacteraceae bacterium]